MSCNIILDNFGGTYLPGSTISGIVVCTFVGKKQIRGIRVKLRGKEHTSWTESRTSHNSRTKRTERRTVHHGGTNRFLSYVLILNGEGTMDLGHYEYPFTFILPRNLPDSFKGFYGHITYYIKASVDIPFASDYEETKYFAVNSPIDFNYIQSELQLLPSLYQDEKTICCCCCANGPITLDVHLQKQAFVVGEAAKIKIHVKNLSNESINYITLKLKNAMKYSATSSGIQHKNCTELLASATETGVGAHGEKMYELDFRIPISKKVYNFRGCTLIEQRSFFEVEAALKGCHTNMKVVADVVLGHIPLRSFHSPSFEPTSFHFPAVQDDSIRPPPYHTLETMHHPIPNVSDAKATAPIDDIVPSPSSPIKAEMSRY